MAPMARRARKMMLVGETGSGKTTLTKVLSGEGFTTTKTQAVVYSDGFLDTPGEFLENRRFYTALITSSCDCDVIGLVQDATRKTSLFPPQFSTIFSKPVVGIVSKVDVEEGNPDLAERFLAQAGARVILRISSKEGTGLDTLEQYLEEEQA